MKNLYESILNDIEDTIEQGDDYANNIETEFNKLKKELCLGHLPQEPSQGRMGHLPQSGRG